MKIIFLIDCNKKSGLGHLYRNFVFAKELKEKKCKVIFFVNSFYAKNLCFKEGFIAFEKKKLESKNYPKADAIVIDSYNISQSYISKIKNNYFLKIIIIDKLLKHCNCELIINHNLYAKNLNYSNLLRSKILKGPEFNLIDKNFFKKNKKRKEITIFFGGRDNGILSFSVAKELLKFVSYRINIIISGFQKPYQKLIKLSNESNLIKIIQNKHTYSIFFRSKLYIGSSGLTAYEAYMSKIPGVIFSKSSNQKMNSIALKKRGFKVIEKFNPKLIAIEACKLLKTKKKIKHNYSYGANKIANKVIKILS